MLRKDTSIAYDELFATFRRGLRNGNWRKLRFLDKALYRASLWYAKHRCIINEMLVEKLLGLVARLKETKGMRIFKFRRGFKRAAEMLKKRGRKFWRGVCLGAETKGLVERHGLYILAGGR